MAINETGPVKLEIVLNWMEDTTYRIAGFSREDFNFATGLIRNIKIHEVLIRCIL